MLESNNKTLIILINYQNYKSVQFRLTPYSFSWRTMKYQRRPQTKMNNISSASQGSLRAAGL